MHTVRVVLALCALLVCSGNLPAQQSFTYQGMLKESGVPANGAYDFRFRLWSSASGGSQSGADLFINDLTVQGGQFTTELNFGNVWDGSERYLEIAVRAGSSTGAYTTLAPRVKITRAPYAIRADTAPPVGAAGGDLSGTYPYPVVAGMQGRPVGNTAPTAGQVLKWDGSAWSPSTDLRDQFWLASGSDIFYNAGKVGVGTSSPYYPLHVEGSEGAVYGRATSVSSSANGVTGQSDSPGGKGIFGLATAANSLGYGVYGENWGTDGSGVLGYSTASTGPTVGVIGRSVSTSGKGVVGEVSASSGTTYGVYGWSNSPSGTGVFGWTTASLGTTSGVAGQNDSSGGRGVFGWASASDGYTTGVYGKSDSTNGTGVSGWASAASGNTTGVHGQSNSTSGTGVYGHATASSGNTIGVYGRSNSTAGDAIVGWASATTGSTTGVYGQSNSTAGFGVYGWKPSGGSGYGVYYVGGLAGTGTKSFQMDHPLSPETHFLNHFCTEGPEPYNAYSGNVTTDAQGYAVVQLPDYFEIINRDFRYQLTCIGQFAQAIVAEEIRNNRFVIRTDKPYVKVSWRVEAIRNDRWVQEYGYEAEQPKPAEYRGKYLHPELYGQPKELGIHYRPMPERETTPVEPDKR
ncbi:MAG: hypothetical protein KatS3mg022_2505 [Armatimonadota bacterium]|nr:MAG: hypothetical protein KatS3mg022_2505 [Armatimonadota bacterium]